MLPAHASQAQILIGQTAGLAGTVGAGVTAATEGAKPKAAKTVAHLSAMGFKRIVIVNAADWPGCIFESIIDDLSRWRKCQRLSFP